MANIYFSQSITYPGSQTPYVRDNIYNGDGTETVTFSPTDPDNFYAYTVTITSSYGDVHIHEFAPSVPEFTGNDYYGVLTGYHFGGDFTVLNRSEGGYSSSFTWLFTSAVDNTGSVTLYSDARGGTFVPPACYAGGSRILTMRGEVPVEALAVGDMVVTASGARRPVRWIGHRHVDITRHPDPQAVRPVRITVGAFGENLPCRDLIVSPDHAILCRDVLVPARCLLNGATVVEDDRSTVTYWHVELDSHDIILAENLPAESYLDCGNRSSFANTGGPVDLHADFAPGAVGRHLTGDYCRPYANAGPGLAAARERLRQRAEILGWTVAPFHADLRAVVDGIMVRPKVVGSEACFALPAGARSVRLVSHTFSPQDFAAGRADARRLGLLVHGLAVTQEGTRCDMALDDVALATGFHALEGSGRWTDGNARLDLSDWVSPDNPALLHVKACDKLASVWRRPEPEGFRRSA